MAASQNQNSAQIRTEFISSPPLELQSCLPTEPSTKPPIFFLHGASCAAHCYHIFLPIFASRGYLSYAVSIRNYGKSWKPNWTSYMFLTRLTHFGDDVEAGLETVRERHDGVLPIVVGHSFGGGVLQYMLSEGRIKARALVLLTAAQIHGNFGEIMKNWQHVEVPEGYAYPWSPRSQLETVDQVRSVFFSPDTDLSVIEDWLANSKSNESARAGLAGLWPFGISEKVLENVEGINGKRKVFFVCATNDLLLTPEMVRINFETYQNASSLEAVATVEVRKGGHHVMLDIGREDCASEVLKWLERGI